MAVKIVDYDQIYDTIDIIYTSGEDIHTRIVALPALVKLIDKIKKKKLDVNMSAIDERIMKEISSNGGMEWVNKEINNIQNGKI